MPEISALMSVYNGEKYIADAINSILNQTFRDFELIIVNDGSTDNTMEIIKNFKDERIRIFQLNQNVGVGAALNVGLSHIRGKYVAKVDADDISYPQRFEKQKDFLDKNKGIILVKSLVNHFPDNLRVAVSQRYKYIKEVIEVQKNNVISTEDISNKLYWYLCIPHTTMMIYADILKQTKYNELRLCEDHDLCLFT